jgi:hypothetical protein
MAVRGASATSWAVAAIVVAVLTLPVPSLNAQQAPAASGATAAAEGASTLRLSLEQQEEFLKKAKIVRTRGAGKGVTGTVRATLSDGTITHDASIQTIDAYIAEFKSRQGVEFNFRDSWRYNVAAYRLDRMLDIGMTPPSIERNYQNKPGAFTWWVDDVMMDEAERLKTKVSAPDTMAWNQQMWVVRVFDQLIYNVDRNLGNLLIDKTWTVWMIDHSRAFRLVDKLKSPESVTRCDRGLLEKLKTLDEKSLKSVMGDYLTGPEIRGVLARRNELVTHIEKAGPGALYDRRVVTTQ